MPSPTVLCSFCFISEMTAVRPPVLAVSPGDSLNKIGYLESLRGLAALVVVITHFVTAFYPALYWGLPGQAHLPGGIEAVLSGTPLNLLYNGDFSVAIFFVLSGYVLSFKFFHRRDSEVFLLPLVAKRYVRLFVPVLFSLALAYAFLKLSFLANGPAGALTRSFWLGSYWQFAPDLGAMVRESFLGFFSRHAHTYNPVLWTMTVEFYGSLIVYVFVAFFRNSPRRFLVYAAAAVLSFQSYYLAFVLGIALCDLTAGENRLPGIFRSPRLLAVLLLAGLFLGSYPMERQVEGTIYAFLPTVFRPRSWHVWGAVLVMIAVLQSRRLQAVLSKKPLLFLGRISFSQYILHLLIICSLSCSLLLTFGSFLPYHVAALLAFCLSLPVIMVVSHLAYMAVDRTSVVWSQRAYSHFLRLRQSFLRLMRPAAA